MPDYATQLFNALMETRVRNWAGVSYKMPRGMVGGRRIVPESHLSPPFYRYNIFETQTYFSAFHISEQTIVNYLEGMMNNRVEWMTGYAMANFFIADLIRKLNLKAPKMKAVITSSEKLTQKMKNTISEVFQCPVFDSYSGGEACGLISESAEGELLVSPDVGIMEFVDENGIYVTNGEIGEIISTGLINFDQPLIRYCIGDMARLAKNQALKTNHHMQKVDEIIGRIEDIVVGSDGRKMVRFHSLFIEVLGLIKSQIIQNSYSDFTIKLIIDKNLYNREDAEFKISKRLESQLGKSSIHYQYVDTLPTEKNGKIKAVVSFVKE